LAQAKRCADFLITEMQADSDGHMLHTYKGGVAKYAAMLDDYACLTAALIDLYEVTYEEERLTQACTYQQIVLDEFGRADGLFYYTAEGQTDVIVRKTDLYDHATPSGNSVVNQNLLRLGHLCGNTDWIERAHTMLTILRPVVAQYPLSFANWAVAMQWVAHDMAEIVVTGPSAQQMGDTLVKTYVPNAVLATDRAEASTLTIFDGKKSKDATLIYICRNFACERPTDRLADFHAQIFTHLDPI
jgi:uncharacterized protein